MNWYGKLIGVFLQIILLLFIDKLTLAEYRNAHPITAPTGAPPTKAPPGLDCRENIVKFGSIPRFTYTLEIAESSRPFGGHIQTFSNKKDAKQYAAKKAIDWLIANNLMPSDGSVRFLPPPPPIQGVQPKKRKSSSDSSNSPQGIVKYPALIPALCAKLGFSPPRYELNKAENTSFWSGYAFFPDNPFIDGKVGKATDVYGKEKAKEEIAEEVYKFLKDIERQREGQFEIQDSKRFRPLESDLEFKMKEESDD